MTIASFFYQRRRLLVFCAATLALHGLAIDWAARNMAASSTREAQAAVMTAQLRVALPKRVESAPLAEVQPLAERPKAQDKPNPKPPSRPLPPPLSTAASRAITPVASDLPAPAQASVEALLAETAAVAVVEQAAPAAAAAAVPPAAATVPEQAPAARRYKVQLPPSATFDMDVARVDADGTKWSGAATMTWHTDGSRYRASVEAGISLLVTRLNLLVLRSEGAIDDNGIAPDKVTEKRARRAETATHFNRGGEGGEGRGEVAKTITFSTSGRSFPLLPGAQDKATVPFQLAAIGRADVNQFGADIDIQVGEDKDAGIYRFQLVGEDELDTRMGKLITWHLTRPPKPGSYSSRLDIWLAPGLQWYPVQIRNTEASGALTTQTVAHIKQTETGQ